MGFNSGKVPVQAHCVSSGWSSKLLDVSMDNVTGNHLCSSVTHTIIVRFHDAQVHIFDVILAGKNSASALRMKDEQMNEFC